jgi:peptide/nickel transport system permease protein
MTMRMMRTMMLEVLRQDYIRTAWAKGLRERVVVVRHALKNALIPVITVVGTQIPWMVGGAVIIETVFALPGLGTLMIDSIFSRDYPAVSGINMIVGTFLVLVNFLVDITYAWLDPRIRYR